MTKFKGNAYIFKAPYLFWYYYFFSLSCERILYSPPHLRRHGDKEAFYMFAGEQEATAFVSVLKYLSKGW